MRYKRINAELEKEIKSNRTGSEYKFLDENAIRRNQRRDKGTILRPMFIRDVEKILYLPTYNRYADKTQVFSLHKNDDISRRGLHVQLVSHIARNIGRILGLNLELIEAIALGHDLGHTPFGHEGERFLNELYHNNTSRYFNHNVHSVRVLDTIYNRNMTLQTLDGILCHNGEFELKEYEPCVLDSFEDFDKKVEMCYEDKANIDKLVPSTLEGCVVRISDMIAYIGKDRQDAKIAMGYDQNKFGGGSYNAMIINNLTVDIVENSYGKNYLKLSSEAYNTLKQVKKDNYTYIYNTPEVKEEYGKIKPMFEKMYDKLLLDLKNNDKNSLIYKYHIKDVTNTYKIYKKDDYNYLDEPNDDIVVDYIASMTDDYFIEAYKQIFPNDKIDIEYKTYFEDMK